MAQKKFAIGQQVILNAVGRPHRLMTVVDYDSVNKYRCEWSEVRFAGTKFERTATTYGYYPAVELLDATATTTDALTDYAPVRYLTDCIERGE